MNFYMAARDRILSTISVRDVVSDGLDPVGLPIFPINLRWRGHDHHTTKMPLVRIGGPNLKLLIRINAQRVVVSRELQECLVISIDAARGTNIGEGFR